MFKLIKKWYKHNPLRFITYTTVGAVAAVPAVVLLFIFINLAKNDFNLNSMYFDGVRPTIIITNSMEPTIEVNSVITVENVEFDDIELEDIVRYNSKRGFSIVHRVVAIGDGFLVTKGDNNEAVDSEKVTADMLNGRVVSIHNGASPFITLVFGRFQMGHFGKSIARMAIGMVGTALVVAAVLLLLYYIFEIITINLYWYKKRDKMNDSIDWLDTRTTREIYNSFIDRYQYTMKHGSLGKKILLILAFRKYYDVMCTEEKHAKRAKKYREWTEKLLEMEEVRE